MKQKASSMTYKKQKTSNEEAIIGESFEQVEQQKENNSITQLHEAELHETASPDNKNNSDNWQTEETT